MTEPVFEKKPTHPTVTKEQVLGAIKGETYTVLPDRRTTICQLTLFNGFTVDGHSVCASPENFDPVKGNHYAREQALEKVWDYLGWDLKSDLDRVAKAQPLSGEITMFGPKTYIGTKVIHAIRMSRLTYNQLRGWTVPANENGADEGYLVQYADGQETNVPGYTGYVSWSPRDVFERSYREVGQSPAPKPETFLDRLVKEHADLGLKVNKLEAFFETEAFKKLDSRDAHDLREQHTHMANYYWVVNRRLKRLQSAK